MLGSMQKSKVKENRFLPISNLTIFLVGEPELNIVHCRCISESVWCPLDGCDALISQRGTPVQLYSTVSHCTVLVYTHNTNSAHDTLRKK